MNRWDTLTWTGGFSEGFKVFEYTGKTLRIWLFGRFFQIGFGHKLP